MKTVKVPCAVFYYLWKSIHFLKQEDVYEHLIHSQMTH